MPAFVFATGIENSSPTVAGPGGATRRVDEMEKCGHYKHWKDDFRLTLDLGIRCLRYGPPYYKTHVGPGKYDWSFADETFAELKSLGITPIVDLCHFGVPDWIGNFQNPDLPLLFAEYAAAFAQRFPWVKYYTPVNEIYVAATFSALYGWWNERLTSERAFVRAIANLCGANSRAMLAILEHRADAVFVQSESSDHFFPLEPHSIDLTMFLNERRFLPFDLTYASPPNAAVFDYLMRNGMTRTEYDWFMAQRLKSHCIMGNDFYPTNEHYVHTDGHFSPAGETFGYYAITLQYYRRYRLPIMHTETNISDPLAAPAWLRRQLTNVLQLRREGFPMLGFTWYPLTDLVDWDTQLREDNGRVNAGGLYDLKRRIRRAGKAYRRAISRWSDFLAAEIVSPSIDV